MLYVYLDQLHWTSLAKADHRRGGNAYLDSLAWVDAGARSGSASFPLSSAHYPQPANIPDDPRRARPAPRRTLEVIRKPSVSTGAGRRTLLTSSLRTWGARKRGIAFWLWSV